MEIKKPETAWRGNIKQIRKQKLDWILANVNVQHYDPYNPAQSEELTRQMIKLGVISSNNNISMMIKSTESLLIEARRIKGIR